MFTRRLGVLSFVFLVGVACVLTRLVAVQFVYGDEIRDRAIRAHRQVVSLPAVRGAIRAADGALLARDRAAIDILLVPSTFRERALLHAVVDSWVLLSDRRFGPAGEGSGRSVAALRARVRENPQPTVAALLRIPARNLTRDVEDRGALLCVRDGGDLLRHRTELGFRLRQCLGVLRGGGLAFRRSDLIAVGGTSGTLGEALDVHPDEIVVRLLREVRSVEEVGAAVGHDTENETWERISELLARERRWMEDRRQREICDAVCQEVFGRAEPTPRSIGATRFLEMARTVALPYEDTPSGRGEAQRALRAATALMTGTLPRPEDGASSPVLPSPGTLVGEDPLARADAAGLVDVRPSRVRKAWFARKRQDPEYRESDWISARRERDLRNRDRAGRDFRFGDVAPPLVLSEIIGPGCLEGLGFRARPSFARERLLSDEDRVLGRLVGEVGVKERRGTHGVESALDKTLAGVDGKALIDRKGGTHVVRQPVHGRDVVLSLSQALQGRLSGVLPEGRSCGLAIVDVRTGGVVGLASGPRPDDPEEARKQRRELEMERGVLRTTLRRLRELGQRADGWLVQRLARRQLERDVSPAAILERQTLRGVLEHGQAWLRPRLDEIAMIASRSPGWHRAYEPPGQIPPGSVFKAVTMVAGLRTGALDLDATFDCVDTKGRRWHGCKNHGPAIGIRRALEQSCNEYCYRVGTRVGTAALLDTYAELGLFGRVPGLLGRSSRRGLEGDDPRNLAIGGGNLSCAPVRVAGVAASLASGRVVRPWLYRTEGFEAIGKRFIAPAHLAVVHAGMRDACVGARGTARRFPALERLRVAAKTGTADHEGPHGEVAEAWFVGFAPAEAPRWAFAVVLTAVPIESKMWDGRTIEGAHAAPIAIDVLELLAEVTGDRWW